MLFPKSCRSGIGHCGAGRSTGLKSRPGGASAEAGQTPSGTHGEEVLEMEQNNEVQRQEAPERVTGRRWQGWVNV